MTARSAIIFGNEVEHHTCEPVPRLEAAWSKPIIENERPWIEFLRLVSNDTDPAPRLNAVRMLSCILRFGENNENMKWIW